MKDKIYLAVRIVGSLLSVFNALMFFAMRPCWSGISSILGYSGGSNRFIYNLPLIICIFLFLVLASDLIIKKIFRKRWIDIAYCAAGFVFFIVIMVIIALGAADYMRFVWPKFLVSLGIAAILGAVYFLLFIYPKTPLKDNKLFKFGVIGICLLSAVIYLTNFAFNRITYSPVVYAVEDNYQIIFSTNTNATGWVEVGDQKFYDTYNGTSKTFTKIHKVEVPMKVLDEAKRYTVHSQKSIYAGPFGGYMGRDVSMSVDFKPVNTGDGIQYLSFSDIHMNDWLAEKTASFVNNYDFLVLDGDIISDVETFEDANYNNRVAYAITKGQVPVVYARGNHDVKGEYSQELHKFVGAKGENFYYNFYFKDVYGIVLDLGEDHDDGWWEYYGTDHYADYHAKQTAFLTEEVAKRNFDNYAYHLGICHIPVTFVNYRHDHEEVKATWTSLLNQMDIDMFLVGHQHSLMIFEPGLIAPNTTLTYNSDYRKGTYNGYLTDFNFPSFMVSKPGFTIKDSINLTNAKSHIGMMTEVDFATKHQRVYYLNSVGEKVDLLNIFAEKDYGTEIIIDLETKAFSTNL